MKKLGNYIGGQWVSSNQEVQVLYHAITGEAYAEASTHGVDFGAALDYGRKVGGSVLARMTFQERGRMLKALALHLMEQKEKFYAISWATGATRADSWVDIEGGIGNLFSNASLRRQFPDTPWVLEGDPVKLSKEGTFMGHHICIPRGGIAIHINAFNFPVWGMLEKIAVNLLAGMPALVKPATSTSYLTEAVVREIIASGILPEGTLQLVCGPAQGILDSVSSLDVVTFTGSAHTGKKLKSHPAVLEESVPFNLEADSLNSIVLAPDCGPESPEFDIFIKEVSREMTTKAGQKCTAVRRIMVPDSLMDAVAAALAKRLAGVKVGDPQIEGVRMGALASQSQRSDVRSQIEVLAAEQDYVFGNPLQVETLGADSEKGAFLGPVLFRNDQPLKKIACHSVEPFGPVATLMPYTRFEEAIELSKLGKGSLVTTLVTMDARLGRDYVLGAGVLHGRVLLLNRDCARESTGHGSPLPMLTHGGPGRAGGGEEMGGKRGVFHYLRRVAVQGSPGMISEVAAVYQPGAPRPEAEIHPFRKHFEELRIGETLITHKHTVSEADIVNFANVSGDNFYAHMDATSLEGTPFTQRVAHGYFILSKAAGLFVDAKKGPVVLNYGLDECRFTKPVYPGMTIGVKLTVKEKITTEKKTPEDVAKGIVKWWVDVYDETGETVAVAAILTMVRKLKDE